MTGNMDETKNMSGVHMTGKGMLYSNRTGTKCIHEKRSKTQQQQQQYHREIGINGY